MAQILKGIINYIPVNMAVNFIFKQALSKYVIIDEDNANNIDKANQDNSFIILRNLKVNASEINSTHLKYSPMKIITGEIDLISFSFQSDKLTLRVSGVNIQLMPLFEKQQQKEVQNEKIPKNDTQQQTKSSGGFINTFVNYLLGQVEIIIEHVCFKVLTYDVKDLTLTYPSVGLFLSKIAIVKNTKSKPEINIEDNYINNENKKVLFLYGFNISVWNFCIKACENHIDEEKEFLNISKSIKEYNDNDPSFSQMKHFFTKECTILALDNSKGASIDIDIPHKPSNSNNDDLDVNITINSIEIMLYPYQLHNLMMFSKVCALIYNSPSSPPPSPKEEPKPQPQQPAQSTKAKLNFLGFDISGLNVNINMKGLNFVLYETMNNDITYKRLYFYNSTPYKEGSDLTRKGSPVHKYYCYYDRNYYLFSINAITVHFQTNFEEDKSSLKVKVLGIKLTYINFLRREEAQKEVPSNNMEISILESCSSMSSSMTNSAMFVSAIGKRTMDQEPLPNTNDLNEQVYFDILHVDEVQITQSNNAELNVGVDNVVLSLHLVVFFPLINLLYSNILFPQQIRTVFNEEEYDRKHPYKPPQEVQPQTETTLNLNPPEIPKEKANNNNNSKISTVTVHVHVDNVDMFVYPVKRDYQRLDGNEFFYQYYSHYILPFLSQPNGVVFHQNIIERTKSPSYIMVNIPDINVNIMSNNTINLTIADLILQYNSYKIIHLQKHSGTPTAITLDLQTPNTTAISLSLTQEIIVNVTPFIINELLMFMDNFFVGMNILQIYMNFQQKIYNDKTDKLFKLYDIKQFIDKEPSSPTTNSTTKVPTLLAVDGCIKTLTLNVNAKDKENSQEESLIRIVVSETKLGVQMKSDEEMKGVSVDVRSFKLGIKKKNLQNSIINNAEQGNYCWIITTLIENNTPFIHLDFKFGTLFKKRDYRGKEIINLLQQSSNGSISNNSSNVSNDSSVFHNKEYETFLLTHQLPMDFMKTIIDLTINNVYIESFYSQVNDISPSLNTLILAFTKQNKPSIVPLIPLAESSGMIMNLNLKLSKLYIDVFDKGNHDCLVQNFSRALLIIEGLAVVVNPTIISLSLSNIYIFILNNFQFTHKNITNQNELFSPKQHIFFIQKNDSYLRRIGYMELFHLSTVKFQILPKKGDSKKMSILISIDNIEFNTCEDGIYCVKLIVEFVSTQMNNMVKNILPTITESNNNSTNELNKTLNSSSQNASSLNVSTSSSKEFIIQQDYFKVNKSNDTQISNTSAITVNTIVIHNNEEGNNKEPLNENEMKLTLNCIKFTLYEGRDFDFDSQNNDITNIPLDKKVEPKKQTNSVFQIDNDYFKKKKTQSTNNKDLTERARRTKRKISNNISFILTKLQTNIQTEKQINTNSLEVQIDNIEIEDNIPKSKYSKLFSRYYYNKQDTFLLLKLSVSTFEKKEYYSLDFTLTPINILIDFNTLNFILNSISYNPSNIFEVIDFEDLSRINNESNQKDLTNSKSMEEMLIEKQKQMSFNEQSQSQSQSQNEQSTQNDNINFTHIFINELFINVSFDHNYIFPNISDLQIRIKQYNFTGTDEFQKQIETLMLLYIKSVLKQIPSVMFHSISLLRPLANIVDGAFDLVKQPYYSFKSGKGITRGIGKGVKSFFFGLTGETLFLFEKTAAIFQHAFFGRENKTMLGKNSFYKKWIYLGNKKRKQYEEYFHKK